MIVLLKHSNIAIIEGEAMRMYRTLQGMLQAYENIRFTKSCHAKIFVSCFSLLNGNINKQFDALLSNLYRLRMKKY